MWKKLIPDDRIIYSKQLPAETMFFEETI